MAKVQMTAKELNANSSIIAKSAKSLGSDIHKHNVALMEYILRILPDGNYCGDVTVAARFVSALENVGKDEKKHSIVRADAIKTWLSDFAFVNFTKDGPKLSSKSAAFKTAAADGFKAHMNKARLTAWNKYTVEPGDVTAAFVVDKNIISLIDGLEKRVDAAVTKTGKFARQTEKARAGNVTTSAAFKELLELKARIEASIAA
jgi:hypothetical protein